MSLIQGMNAYQVNQELKNIRDRSENNIFEDFIIEDLDLSTAENDSIINMNNCNLLKTKYFYKEFTSSETGIKLNDLVADNNPDITFNNCQIIDIEIRNYRLYPKTIIESWLENHNDYKRWNNILLPKNIDDLTIEIKIDKSASYGGATSIKFMNKYNICILDFTIVNERGSALENSPQLPFIKIFWY